MYQYQCRSCGTEFESNRKNRSYCSRLCQNRANNENAGERLAQKPLITAWGCGGGIDSTAIAALIVNGKLPKPDLAYMTDCGWEAQYTWDYMHNVTIPRLKTVGVNLQIIRSVDDGVDTSLLMDKRGFVLLPAYSHKDGKPTKFRTHCNGIWKVKVAEHWLRAAGVERCENWLGIAFDEREREFTSPIRWRQNCYPLIELKMTRADCIYYLGISGWPLPTRTNCIICPQQNDEQWINLKTRSPIDFARAVAAEESIRKINPDVYLHRSMVPLSEVSFG